jgi:hypothetical protein
MNDYGEINEDFHMKSEALKQQQMPAPGHRTFSYSRHEVPSACVFTETLRSLHDVAKFSSFERA